MGDHREDDILLDDTEPDDPENYLIGRPLRLDSPAALNGASGPVAPQRQYLRYAMRRGRQSVQPGDDASRRFAHPPGHVGRTWMLRNDLGAITLSSIEVTDLLLPAAADLNAPPPAPEDATNYACYRVGVRDGAYTDQTPGRCTHRAPRNARAACLDDADCGGTAGQHQLCEAPRFRRDLQVFLREPFFDECALLADGVTPSFAGTAVEGSCLFDLWQPVELCNPIETSAALAPRGSAADFDPSLPSSTQSLLCYGARLARTIEDARAALLAESTVGTVIAPSQSRYKHPEPTRTAVYTTPGSRFPAPTLVESDLFRNHHWPLVCLPTDVTGIAVD